MTPVQHSKSLSFCIFYMLVHLLSDKRFPDIVETEDYMVSFRSHGYFCGRELPPPVRCNTGCAIVRFVSIPAGLSYTGFRLEWSSSG